jgi:hypothetical protein
VAEAAKQDKQGSDFATALAHGVADFRADDLSHGALTLTFGLSAWMRRCSVGAEEAWAGVLMLRAALLEVAGLDRASEPVPLRASDAKTALVSTTIYLDGLLTRAAKATRQDRQAVMAQAVELLAG